MLAPHRRAYFGLLKKGANENRMLYFFYFISKTEAIFISKAKVRSIILMFFAVSYDSKASGIAFLQYANSTIQ